MVLALSAVILVLAIFAVIRRVDARLVLLLAALAMATLAGDPMAIVRKFLQTLSNEQFVVPICCAMGFGYVLRETACDQHLVHLLTAPLRRVRVLLIPGTVGVGFLVNIPVISQVGTAICIGQVLVPLLRAARVSPATTGAALLLGASLGGDLLNPGAVEWRTVTTEIRAADANAVVSADQCVAAVFPLQLTQLAVATVLFWALSIRHERRHLETTTEHSASASEAATPPFRINPLKAAVPLLPLVLLFLTGPPLRLIAVPVEWLVGRGPGDTAGAESRLIGAAMLLGTIAAATVSWRGAGATARVFFEGAGYGMAHIVSLIVAANCFGEAIKLVGVGTLLGGFVEVHPGLLLPVAAALPLAFAVLCGTGFGTTQSLFQFFVRPAVEAGVDPVQVGALVAVTASAGRTMSPVAAIALMSAAMTGSSPFTLVRRAAFPVLAASAITLAVAMQLAHRP